MRWFFFAATIVALITQALADDASTWSCPSTLPPTPNVLLNPSFETGDPSNAAQPLDWNTDEQGCYWSGNTDANIQGQYQGHSGSQVIVFGLHTSDQGTLTYSASGNVASVPNGQYLLSFWVRFDTDSGSFSGSTTGRQINVIWNGAQVGSVTFDNVAQGGSYAQYCLPTLLTAVGGDTLAIQGSDESDVIIFDDAALQQYDVYTTVTPTSTSATPTTTTSIVSTTYTATITDTISPTASVIATTDTTSTLLTTVTQHPTSTTTLAISTTTVTSPKCKAFHLTFGSGCCPTSIMGVQHHHRRTVTAQEGSITSTAPAVTTTIASPTITITVTTTASTATSTATTTLSTMTTTFTTQTVTLSTSQTSTVTATTIITSTPPAATETVCRPINVPKFACPAGTRSQQILSQLELAFLTLYKKQVSTAYPSLIVQCDGSNTVYTY